VNYFKGAVGEARFNPQRTQTRGIHEDSADLMDVCNITHRQETVAVVLPCSCQTFGEITGIGRDPRVAVLVGATVTVAPY